MAELVNPPPALRLPAPPRSLMQDPDAQRYFRELENLLKQMNQIEFQLWRRTGGGTDIIDTDIVRETYSWDLSTPQAEFSEPYGMFSISEQKGSDYQSPSDVKFEWFVSSSSTDYTMVVGEWLKASGNGKTITFPDYPGDGDRIRITKNADVIKFSSKQSFYWKNKAYTSGRLPGGVGSVFDLEYQDGWYLI